MTVFPDISSQNPLNPYETPVNSSVKPYAAPRTDQSISMSSNPTPWILSAEWERALADSGL